MTGSAGAGYLGVDIGGTNVRAALVGAAGSILLLERWPAEIHLGREHFLGRLAGNLAALRERGAATGIETAAVGLGVPGLIAKTGLVHSSVNLEPLVGLNLKDAVSAETGLPTVVMNDANAAAFGESRYGAGRSYASLLMFTLGTGVGSGLILDGALWTGIDGVAAEYGHATVEPAGLLCPCGNCGCLEQYASATALTRAAITSVQHQGGMLADIPAGELSAETIAAVARRGDTLARSLFEEAGRYLGIVAATVANLLNLEAIIVGGGVAASFDLLDAAIRREVDRRAFAIPAARLVIRPGELGDDAGILGAAALARELSGNAPK